MTRKIKAVQLSGEIHVPPSKSDGQRALLMAALAKSTSRIMNIGSSQDEMAMLECVKALNATVERAADAFLVTGGTPNDSIQLQVGESGLASRLLVSVCAALSDAVVINGSGSILQRDMSFFERTLPQMGVQVVSTNAKLPIQLSGRLKSGEYTVDGSASSQYISGLLIALSLLDQESVLIVENLNSQPYLKMTINSMKKFGIQIEQEGFRKFRIGGEQHFQACQYTVESDWSSASYWLVAAALGHELKLSGLDMSSAQADRMILQAFLAAGCRVVRENELLTIDGTDRKSLDFDATDCPDLFPALAVYGAMTSGISRIRGVHRLANKESDRAKAIISEFGKLGVQVEIEEDTMLIHGGTKLLGGTVDAHHDHRIAMSLAILGTFCQFEVQIEGGDAVRKSYPSFWDDLEKLMKAN
jgi:3-phosphoshikimate 1-carboxyvinyltransferase